MNSRRAILKLIGAAPMIGGSNLKGEIADALASPALAAGAAMASQAQPILQLTGAAKTLDRLRTRADADFYNRQRLRVAGLDPDIAAMRSMSLVHKSRLQYERDCDEIDLMTRVKEAIWGD